MSFKILLVGMGLVLGAAAHAGDSESKASRDYDAELLKAAAPVVLEGKAFCRSVMSTGMFGQPKGERDHCLVFRNQKVTDDANTFFGNPPDLGDYKISGNKLTVTSIMIPGAVPAVYELSADQTKLTAVSGGAVQPGVVLTLKK